MLRCNGKTRFQNRERWRRSCSRFTCIMHLYLCNLWLPIVHLTWQLKKARDESVELLILTRIFTVQQLKCLKTTKHTCTISSTTTTFQKAKSIKHKITSPVLVLRLHYDGWISSEGMWSLYFKSKNRISREDWLFGVQLGDLRRLKKQQGHSTHYGSSCKYSFPMKGFWITSSHLANWKFKCTRNKSLQSIHIYHWNLFEAIDSFLTPKVIKRKSTVFIQWKNKLGA